MQAPPTPIVEHVNQLLAMHGSTFIAAAYRSLLGREPDPYGGSQYLSRLMRDGDKVSILFELASSDEGAQHQGRVAGIRELLASRTPTRSWLRRLLNKSRRVEQSAIRLEASLSFLGDELHGRMKLLENHINQLSTARSDRERALLSEIEQLSLRLDALAAPGAFDTRGRGLGRNLAHSIQQMPGAPPPAPPSSAAGMARAGSAIVEGSPLRVEDLLALAGKIRSSSH